MLRGRKVGLRPLESKDSWLLHKWFNDQRVLEDLGATNTPFCVSMEVELRIVEEIIANKSKRYFMIQSLDGSREIGLIGLSKIDFGSASAELIVLIGEVDCWGKGLGRDAISVVLHHAFARMNLHRVYLRVADYNERAISCYKASGFQIEGRLRHDHFHKGAYRDALIMSILKEEFGGLSDA